MYNNIITVNEYFDHVYLLNLDRRPDRLEKSSKKLEKLNVKFERFSAIDGLTFNNKSYNIEIKIYGKPDCVMGCLLSHYNMIKDAKEKNYKRVLILEDDIMISEKFVEHFQKVKELDDWKLLYLGADQFNWNNIEYKDNFYLSNDSLATFAYGVDNSIYDDIINLCDYYINNNVLMAIDKILVDSIQTKYYGMCFTLFPNIIISNVLDSNIRDVNYNQNFKKQFKWEFTYEFI